MGYTPIPSSRTTTRSRRSNTSESHQMTGDYADQLAAELVRGMRSSSNRSNNNSTNGILHGSEDQQRQQLAQLINITGFEAAQNQSRVTRNNDHVRGIRQMFGAMLSGSTSQPSSIHEPSPHTHQSRSHQQTYRPPPQSTKKPASVLLVESLPTFRFKSTDDGTSSDNTTADDNGCSICISEFVDNEILRLLPCIHRFHRDCIDRWLSINRLCPTCNTDVKRAVQHT